MKKNIKYFILIALLVGGVGTMLRVSAAQTNNFSGSVGGGSWVFVVSPETLPQFIKDSNNSATAVRWDYSSVSNINMWFRIVNSNVENRGESLLSYLETKAWTTSASQGYYYWLQAKRENFFDGSSYIYGAWAQ